MQNIVVKRYAGLHCNGVEARIKSLVITNRLYQYGIDTTKAGLAQTALAHGISASVSEMSQQEKMQLRVLTMLEQSKVAYGDLARTVDRFAA